MSSIRDHILTLSDRLEKHLCVTHWAVSMRVTKKGDFIDRLKRGGDLTGTTYDRALRSFSLAWPSDLEWPSDVPRPPVPKEVRQ